MKPKSHERVLKPGFRTAHCSCRLADLWLIPSLVCASCVKPKLRSGHLYLSIGKVCSAAGNEGDRTSMYDFLAIITCCAKTFAAM
jgi:hypothetical protein